MSAQSICFLAVQPYFLTVGQPSGFANAEDFYRFAASECGFEGVTLPAGTPFIDIGMALTSSSYRDDFQSNLRSFGLRLGAVRLEMHVVGQNVCLDPSRTLKMGHFVSKDFRTLRHDEIERLAVVEMMRIIDASSLLGFRHLPGFCGGRGYAKAQAKWSAWPKHFPEWVLALLAYHWQPILEYSSERGVIITFEIGHPENDLLTGENFVVFRSLLSEKARKGVGVNADGSHFVNVGTNPMPHFKKAESTGCDFTNHYKWGAVRDEFDGSASPYGGWRPWSTASTTFFTIGTVGPEELVRQYHAFIARRHELQEGGVDIVYEGECVGIPSPKQAMKVGADNCRALRDGKSLVRLQGVVTHDQPIQMAPFKEATAPSLIGTFQEQYVTQLEPWAGGPFDVFADCPAKPHEILAMSQDEVSNVKMILLTAGFVDAAKAT